MNYEKGDLINSSNPYIKTTPRKWTDSEIEYMLQLKKEGKSLDIICDILGRSYASVSVKLKRLKKKEGTYNQKHLMEKNRLNREFVALVNPSSLLDLYCGEGNPAYKNLNVTSNDINSKFDCDYNLDALHCICKLYSDKKKFDVIDLDPFGSAYDCLDLAIKMATKGLCVTLGEMGHRRWKRLDYVSKCYGINSLEDFNSDNIIKHIQNIGKRNKKNLKIVFIRDWQLISRVWFIIEPYKETSQWNLEE